MAEQLQNKKKISYILSLIMLASAFPTSAFASTENTIPLEQIEQISSELEITTPLTTASILQVVQQVESAPKSPSLSSNQWGGDYDDIYDLTWNIYYVPNASKWELYEKRGRLGSYELVKQGDLKPNTPHAQSGTISINSNKKPGTYFYQIKLINEGGSSLSNECKVTVGAPNDEKTLLVGIDDTGAVNQFTINQNTYLYPIENIEAETEAVFEVATNNKDIVSVSIQDKNKLKVTGLKGGRASIKITEKKTGNVRYVGYRVKDKNGKLPGMPDYVVLGSVSEDTSGDLSFWKDFDGDLRTNKRMDIRYIYINGGPLSNGWKDWTSNKGDRSRTYIADFISIDKYGLDGAYESGAGANPAGSRWLWNSDTWNNYLEYAKTLGDVCDLPVILWQIPVGHLNDSKLSNPYNGGCFPNLTNAVGNYEDSAPTFFLGDTFKLATPARLDYFGSNAWNDPKVQVNGDTITWGSRMDECKDKGITAILFGAGVGASTDSVGTPPADNYWWITKAQGFFTQTK